MEVEAAFGTVQQFALTLLTLPQVVMMLLLVLRNSAITAGLTDCRLQSLKDGVKHVLPVQTEAALVSN